MTFPKLAAKYGPSVSFADGEYQHSQVEFAFDANQVAKHHLAPGKYLHEIGLDVPRQQITAAFYETYGFPVRDIIGLFRPALRTFRFGARSFLPNLAYAEAVLHAHGFPPDIPGPELDTYEDHMTRLATVAGWDHYNRKPGIRTHLLAVLVWLVPKIGPAKMLSIKGPTAETEQMYIESVNRSTMELARALDRLAKDPTDLALTNRDLDTGAPVVPGGYRLTDQTYAKLLARITKHAALPIPNGLKRDILSYYSDPNAQIVTKLDAKKWARVQAELQVLTGMETQVEPK
jgi:hypothetical protein